ncbi:hypothetical protein [Kribbella voronezhensis]|uniref:hypothetical protein n=1 Tax=Kribbella voronezhensis TaxID=2512212 RepID=UPI001063A977|nr:hypothetical protein [Kribbella voronezhensis]
MLAEEELNLVWGAWVELGVSGWQRTHGAWAVDPEPLIIRTASLGEDEPRLRDEALDWCIRYPRYVSLARLRNLLRDHPDPNNAWGRFAATINAHSNVRWPMATQEDRYQPTGRSNLDSLDRQSRVWLRLRAMFGIGARTEILRYFLAVPPAPGTSSTATVSVIANSIGYAKRNVADECEVLEMAGLLKRRQVGNRFSYSLRRETSLRDLVGEMAPIRPDWSALLKVTSSLVALESFAGSAHPKALLVEAHRTAQQLDDQLDVLQVEGRPRFQQPDSYWAEVHEFGLRLMSAWGSGRWTAGDQAPAIPRSKTRRK